MGINKERVVFFFIFVGIAAFALFVAGCAAAPIKVVKRCRADKYNVEKCICTSAETGRFVTCP
jgi:hypothetical protein